MRMFAVSIPLLLGFAAVTPFAANAVPEVPDAARAGATASFQVKATFFPRAQRKPVLYEVVKGLIVFKASIAGRDVWVLLDNGSERSLIDIPLARASLLAFHKRVGNVLGPTGKLPIQGIVANVPFIIPGQVDMRAPLTVVDLAPLSKIAGQKIEAVIGADFFGFMALAVNAGNGTIQLGPSGSGKPTGKMPMVSLQNGKAQVEMLVAGKPVLLTIDLGSGGGLALMPEAWARIGLQDAKLQSRPATHPERLSATEEFTIVPEVRIGPLILSNVPVGLQPLQSGAVDGSIGMRFLGGTNFALDIKAAEFWIAPRARPRAPNAQDPLLSIKQLSITFPPGTPEKDAADRISELVRTSQTMGGCSGAEAAAARLGAELVTRDQTPLSQMPLPLQEMLRGMKIGDATKPFGNRETAVRVLILCGWQDPAPGGPG